MTGSLEGGAGNFTQLLLGICAGAMLAMAAAMLRAPRPAARWTGFAFFFTSAFFALKLWNDEVGALAPEIRAFVGITAMTSVGWFWLMVMALFSDLDRFRPVLFLAPAAMGVCGVLNVVNLASLAPAAGLFGMALQSTLTIWSIFIVMRSWPDDLVESRRRLRGPFMVAIGLYILSLNGLEIWEMIGTVPAWYPMFNAALLAGVVLGGALVFLDPREAMFGEGDARTNGNDKRQRAQTRPGRGGGGGGGGAGPGGPRRS
jgi:hypothetical protein